MVLMGKTSIFERRTLLQAAPEEVYAFHEDPRNLTKISPPFLKLGRLECSVPAMVGGEFRLPASLLGLRLEWVGFWEEVVPDSKLVDGARKSPFRHWRHLHIFSAVGEGKQVTMMTDRLEYALAWGNLGRFLDLTVMKMFFTLMFLARHRAMRRVFSRMEAKGARIVKEPYSGAFPVCRPDTR